jgi:HNH endonuclease
MIQMDELRMVAGDLQQQGQYWRSFKRIEHLMGWLYDKGKCVYCDEDLVEKGHTITGSATTDHLLPKRKYIQLDDEPLNAVPACSACNHLKGQWDPNERGDTPALTADLRREFVARARGHIRAKRQKRAAEFQLDLEAWQRALRRCRELDC